MSPATAGGESKTTGVGASVRMNGDAAWLKRGSIGTSGGGDAGYSSLTDRAS
jgi:hypothetical protein